MEPLEWIALGLGATAGLLFTGERKPMIRAAARVYVKLARKTGQVVDPIVQEWQSAVQQSAKEEEQQASRNGQESKQSAGKHMQQGDKAIKGAGKAAQGAVDVGTSVPTG